MLCMGLSDMQQCKIIAFCIIFLSLFCVNISSPVESVYWFHIVFPWLCACRVSFLLCGRLICTLCSHTVQWSALGIVILCLAGYIKAETCGGRSDLTELQGESTTGLQEETTFCRGKLWGWWVKICARQGFVEAWKTTQN